MATTHSLRQRKAPYALPLTKEMKDLISFGLLCPGEDVLYFDHEVSSSLLLMFTLYQNGRDTDILHLWITTEL
eukprot:m.211345 g.211345  ORF g.211345 m.211345 type:complete len:73 (-) comp15835_c0_seq1:2469-2687(-)